MAKASGSTKTSTSRNPRGLNESRYDSSEHIQLLTESLKSYSQSNVSHNATGITYGFHTEVVDLMERVAAGDYGVATAIAQQYMRYGNGMRVGYQLSDKQAYVVAKAAVDNKIISRGSTSQILSYAKLKETKERVERKRTSEAAIKKAKRDEYNASYKKSTTNVAAGSSVTNSKGQKGVIVRVITPSTGYVEVNYGGTTRKEMAFNLFGSDGNPLKKKPNR